MLAKPSWISLAAWAVAACSGSTADLASGVCLAASVGEGEGEGESPSEGEADGDPVPLSEHAWLATLSIAEMGDFEINLQLEIELSDLPEGGRVVNRFAVRALALDNVSASEILAEAADLPVDEEGRFDVGFEDVTLPGPYTVTGSDVLVSITFHARIQSEELICGELSGEVTTIETDLAGSTFGAVPWDRQDEGVPSRCEAAEEVELPRMAQEDCPAMEGGRVRGFPSSGLSWDFVLALPEDAGDGRSWPLVFLYHGLPSDVASVMAASEMDRLVDDLGFILVVPESRKVGTYWDFALDRDSVDLALFDDLVTCVSAAYPVDPDRVHVTGMSGGGLWTGKLSFWRSEVIASAAPMSGGILVSRPSTERKMPVMVTWGGEDDLSHGQDFHLLSAWLIEAYAENGNFIISCNHGTGHSLVPEFSPWVLRFLLDHPRGVDPDPYAAGLPDAFPGFCEVVSDP